MIPGALDSGLAELRRQGLNLQGTVCRQTALDLAPDLADLPQTFPSLLLVGSSGQGLWDTIVGSRSSQPHPIDSHCLGALTAFGASAGAAGVDTRLIWHGGSDRPFPVVQLGEALGWSQRSRMGIGIHPQRGLWFAYRGVVAIGQELRVDSTAPPPGLNSPCAECEGTPCISVCPVSAVGGPGGVDLGLCFDERERQGAVCGGRCLSRLACPVGSDHRYSLAQIAHHHHHAQMPDGWRESLPVSPPEWQE